MEQEPSGSVGVGATNSEGWAGGSLQTEHTSASIQYTVKRFRLLQPYSVPFCVCDM